MAPAPTVMIHFVPFVPRPQGCQKRFDRWVSKMSMAEPTSTLSHRQVMLALSGLMIGLFIAAVDQTIVSTAIPEMVTDLGGIRYFSWIVVGYLLTSTASTPLWGKIGDLFGRRRMFQTAILIFLLGSMACGFAPTMFFLIVGRLLQGIGGGATARTLADRPAEIHALQQPLRALVQTALAESVAAVFLAALPPRPPRVRHQLDARRAPPQGVHNPQHQSGGHCQ